MWRKTARSVKNHLNVSANCCNNLKRFKTWASCSHGMHVENFWFCYYLKSNNFHITLWRHSTGSFLGLALWSHRMHLFCSWSNKVYFTAAFKHSDVIFIASKNLGSGSWGKCSRPIPYKPLISINIIRAKPLLVSHRCINHQRILIWFDGRMSATTQPVHMCMRYEVESCNVHVHVLVLLSTLSLKRLLTWKVRTLSKYAWDRQLYNAADHEK